MDAPTIAINRERIVYDGPLGRLREHRHAVIGLLFGLEDDFAIATQRGGERNVRFSLVPADVGHRLDFFGRRTLVVYVEPHDDAYGALHRRARSECLDLGELPNTLLAALSAWTQRHDHNPVLQAVTQHFEAGPNPLDERIVRLAQLWNHGELLQAEAAELARAVALSPSRLLHLFKSELGVGVRRLKQHYRFKIATQTIASGETFTRAAHRAGFSDSAHLSRAFAETFGLSPTAALGFPVNWLLGESRGAYAVRDA